MKALKKDMQNAADNLEFEKAAEIRDEIRKLEHSDMGLTINSFTKNYKNKNISKKKIINMQKKKTGKLFGFCCESIAVINEEKIKKSKNRFDHLVKMFD